jgi:hypothetical protein
MNHPKKKLYHVQISAERARFLRDFQAELQAQPHQYGTLTISAVLERFIDYARQHREDILNHPEA